jgi:acyl-CoA thioesterase-1
MNGPLLTPGMKVALSILIILSLGFSQEKEKTIVFFGDSLTAGYGLDPVHAFPALIEEQLQEQGSFKVINAGLSGETSAGGLGRIDWILNQKVDIFILELGANDGLRGLPITSTRQNLQAIIDKVQEKSPGVKIVLAGMKVPPNMGADYAKQFDETFAKLANENDIPLIPFLLDGVAGQADLNLADGIHPNIEGHKIVAENVMAVLKPLL